MNEIASDKLQLMHIPSADASGHELIHFADTFNGYEEMRSFEACAAIANHRDHSSLDHLRACLFFEARRERHCDDGLDPETLAYWRELVRKSRELVAAREA